LFANAEKKLSAFARTGQLALLGSGLTGLEKESLRVAPDGHIAQTPHPQALGSALTHPWITTDYSEALLEFITPPLADPASAVAYLRDLEHYAYLKLDNELLWCSSMPCVLAGDASIPIAQYGMSNLGLMKTVYRRGLGYRYGRVMQVIAGAHYNYSFGSALWPVLQEFEGDRRPLQEYVSDCYFRVIRNLQRIGWLVPYLFGCSPAVCMSFIGGKPTILEEFNDNTYYGPHATSLRICDIGYQNSHEAEAGFKATYDSLEAYTQSLLRAIETPCPTYQEFGVKVAGEYRQLNASILQIENEYYSSVRPKQIPGKNEKPALALRRRGVRYVELRSLDINVFDPQGISTEQCRFLETLMTYCLFDSSPRISEEGRGEIDHNLDAVGYRGRQPGLQLQRDGTSVTLQQWAMEICNAMQDFAAALDVDTGNDAYSRALQAQVEAVRDPDRTPSARILAAMCEHEEGFYQFTQGMSLQHQRYFLDLPLDAAQAQAFDATAAKSLEDQRAIEAADRISFDDFLKNYFAQQP
jgi:glutamate--cysteine ligase